jgi:hypothetical protein
MLNNEQIKLLKVYKDKSYVLHILCNETNQHYQCVKNFLSFPIILSSAIMTIINSSELEPELLKPINIIINAITTIILSYMNNYKIAEKSEAFKNLGNKMIKLSHDIEDKLTNDIDNVTIDDIRDIINRYDSFNESILYEYPKYIKNKVLLKLKDKYILPNILVSYSNSNSNSNSNSINNSTSNLNEIVTEALHDTIRSSIYNSMRSSIKSIKSIENINNDEYLPDWNKKLMVRLDDNSNLECDNNTINNQFYDQFNESTDNIGIRPLIINQFNDFDQLNDIVKSNELDNIKSNNLIDDELNESNIKLNLDNNTKRFNNIRRPFNYVDDELNESNIKINSNDNIRRPINSVDTITTSIINLNDSNATEYSDNSKQINIPIVLQTTPVNNNFKLYI